MKAKFVFEPKEKKDVIETLKSFSKEDIIDKFFEDLSNGNIQSASIIYDNYKNKISLSRLKEYLNKLFRDYADNMSTLYSLRYSLDHPEEEVETPEQIQSWYEETLEEAKNQRKAYNFLKSTNIFDKIKNLYRDDDVDNSFEDIDNEENL